jgi:hypothetical protein
MKLCISGLVKKLALTVLAGLPAIDKLNKAISMIDVGKWQNAQEFIRQIGINIDTIATSYSNEIPALKNIKKMYDLIVGLVREQKSATREKVKELIDVLSNAQQKIQQMAIR